MKTVLISCMTHNAANYINALRDVGVNPIPSDKIEDENNFDGLLLPGGGDIAPIFYHRKNRGSMDICIAEDIIQMLLFHRFMEQGKPIIGICKGMQLINVALGGSLIQELPTGCLHATENDCVKKGDRFHNTKALSGSRLHSIYGDNCITNSAHHQAINKLGNNLLITQYAPDGVAEAIEHTSLPIIGVQWHPERMNQGHRLFSYFAELL